MSEINYSQYPSIYDIVKDQLHLLSQRIVLQRMDGLSLRDLAQEEGLTRTEIRRIENEALERLFSKEIHVCEDEYKYLYQTYYIDDDFFNAIPHGTRILYYLKNRYEAGLQPLKNALDDTKLTSTIISQLQKLYPAPVSEDHQNTFDSDEFILPVQNTATEASQLIQKPVSETVSANDNYPTSFDQLPDYVIEALTDLRNTFLACGITNEKQLLEQVGIFLFLKHLDELELKNTANVLNGLSTKTHLFFDQDHQHCRWSTFKHYESVDLLNVLQNDAMQFIKTELRIDMALTYAKLLKNVSMLITDPLAISRIISDIDTITSSADIGLDIIYKFFNVQKYYDKIIFYAMTRCLDLSMESQICNPYLSAEFALDQMIPYIKETFSYELTQLWNKSHFQEDMFFAIAPSEKYASTYALGLRLAGVLQPHIDITNILCEKNPPTYNRIITKIPTTPTISTDNICPDITDMVSSNIPYLYLTYACDRMLAPNGIASLYVSHKLFSDNNPSALRLRKYFTERNTILGIIYIPSRKRNILIYQKTPSSTLHNVWFARANTLTFDAMDSLIAHFNQRATSQERDMENSFFVPVWKIAENNYQLQYDYYSTDSISPTEDAIPSESYASLLQRIYHTQQEIDHSLAIIQHFLENK